MKRWPSPQAIKTAIEIELIEAFHDSPLVMEMIARKAVERGIKRAINAQAKEEGSSYNEH